MREQGVKLLGATFWSRRFVLQLHILDPWNENHTSLGHINPSSNNSMLSIHDTISDPKAQICINKRSKNHANALQLFLGYGPQRS